MTGRTGVLVMMTAVVALSACKKKEPAQPVPATTTPTTTTSSRDTAAENRAARETAQRDAEARDAAARAAAGRAATSTLGEMVFFEYDQADIRSDMQDVLDRKASLLRANPNVTLRVDGHADERGTVEYNLALSLRRANAVREYLTGAGVEAARLEVAGFGEERPLDPSGAESAFARNRRAEFQVTRGGDNLVPAR